jgi:hypothetical protein
MGFLFSAQGYWIAYELGRHGFSLLGGPFLDEK